MGKYAYPDNVIEYMKVLMGWISAVRKEKRTHKTLKVKELHSNSNAVWKEHNNKGYLLMHQSGCNKVTLMTNNQSGMPPN